MKQATVTPDPLSLVSALGHEVWTAPAMLQARAQLSPDAPALWAKSPSGKWHTTTWRRYHDVVAAGACGFRAMGVQRGDRVGIMAPSSPQWDIAQLSILAAGGVVVGLDPYDTDERLRNVVAQCELTGLVVQNEDQLRKLGSGVRDRLRFIVTLQSPAAADTVALDALVKSRDASQGDDWNIANEDDPALVIFTSGTTGEPKGIEYSHRQVCQAVASILGAFPDIREGSRLACWLPLSNLFQRMINLCAIGRGAQTYYVEDPKTIMQHVAAIAPHLFIGVPRFYEKLHAGITEAIDAKPAWQRRLTAWAAHAGERYATAVRAKQQPDIGQRFAFAIADRLVLRRIRGVMGPNLRYLISGSAPMPPWLLARFHTLGLLVLEAYGLSECIIPVATNRPRDFRFGTVGLPMSGVEVRLAPDGELMLRGPGVFGGYLGDRESEGRIDEEGFLASGDYATIDADGFITLIGRKSEIFKTSTGRRVAPARVESQLRTIPYVEHAVVFGANRQFLTAVVAISRAALDCQLAEGASTAPLASLNDKLTRDIGIALKSLPDHLRPAGIVLTTNTFASATGELTPNLKLRRAQVEASYRGHLDELYELLARTNTQALPAARDEGRTLLLSL